VVITKRGEVWPEMSQWGLKHLWKDTWVWANKPGERGPKPRMTAFRLSLERLYLGVLFSPHAPIHGHASPMEGISGIPPLDLSGGSVSPVAHVAQVGQTGGASTDTHWVTGNGGTT
jgi:hypothetical protein